MTPLRRNAGYLGRLLAFCCCVDTWQRASVMPLKNEAVLRECERWMAWHVLGLVSGLEGREQ